METDSIIETESHRTITIRSSSDKEPASAIVNANIKHLKLHIDGYDDGREVKASIFTSNKNCEYLP